MCPEEDYSTLVEMLAIVKFDIIYNRVQIRRDSTAYSTYHIWESRVEMEHYSVTYLHVYLLSKPGFSLEIYFQMVHNTIGRYEFI